MSYISCVFLYLCSGQKKRLIHEAFGDVERVFIIVLRHWLKIYRLEPGLDIVLKTYDLGPPPVITEMSAVFLPFSDITGQIYRRMPLV